MKYSFVFPPRPDDVSDERKRKDNVFVSIFISRLFSSIAFQVVKFQQSDLESSDLEMIR